MPPLEYSRHFNACGRVTRNGKVKPSCHIHTFYTIRSILKELTLIDQNKVNSSNIQHDVLNACGNCVKMS